MLRDRLRQETRISHQKLDSFVGGLDPFTSANGYRVYLLAMDQLHQRYAKAMEQAAERCDLPPTSAALRDCIAEDLGVRPQSIDQGVGDPTEEQLWAAAYVMEGSAMGARHIVKEVERSDLKLGHSFLSRLVEESYQRWPQFVAGLESAECDIDQTVLEAQRVFEVAREAFGNIAERCDVSVREVSP